MYQLSRSKNDVQRMFSEPLYTKKTSPIYEPEIDEDESIKEYNEKVIDDNLNEEDVENLFDTGPKEELIEEPNEEISEKVLDDDDIKEELIEEPNEEVENLFDDDLKEELIEEPKEEISEKVLDDDLKEELIEEPNEEITEKVIDEGLKEENVDNERIEAEENDLPIGEEEVLREETTDPFSGSDEEEIMEETDKEEENVPEEPMEDLPITVYDYDGEGYFVDPSPFLQRIFDFPDGTYNTNLCIYSCCRNGAFPFLQYLTVYDKETNSLIFPRIISPELKEEHSIDEVREQYMDSFKKALFELFPPTVIETSDEEKNEDVFQPNLFKGIFVERENLCMVYDATRVQNPLTTNKEYFWVTPYEILVLYKYRNIDINESVTSMFKTIASSSGFIDKKFYHLRRVSDGELVPTPYILFPCSKTNGGLFSSNSYENRVQDQEEIVDLTISTVDHPILGNVPMFSAVPIDPHLPKIQRYVVFVDTDGNKPTFMKEGTVLDDDIYGIHQTKQYSSISFFENGKQFWVIKSPLYFTEIRDLILNEIPITSFSEISSQNLPVSNDEIDNKNKETNSVKSNDEDDEVISNEGDEVSDDGLEESEDGDEESNEGSVDEDSEDDNYEKGYQEGFISGLKEKANSNLS